MKTTFTRIHKPGYFLRLLTLCMIVIAGLPIQSFATLVTIGAAYSTSSSVTGLYARYAFTSGESIYTPAEVGSGGNITTFALNKGSGSSTTAVDSVYIYMKETASSSIPSTPSLTGYTLVYSGDFTNSSTSGWQTVTLTTPFAYTGTGYLDLLIVRHNGTAMTSSVYPRYYYDYSSSGATPHNYYYSSSDYWSSWGTSSASASTSYTSPYYRPQIQITVSPFAACSGKPTAGTAVASITTACPAVPVTLSLSGSTLSSSISYSWDTSSTGTGGWGLAGTSTTFAGVWAFTPPTGTTLYYRCRATCGTLSDTSTTVAVTVGTSSLPYSETFESTSYGVFPPCTYATFVNSYEGFYVYDYTSYPSSITNHTPGGNNYLFAGYYLGMNDGTPDFFFTPALPLDTGKTYQFSYWYNTDGYGPYTAGAYYGTAQTKAAMTTAIGPDIYPNNTSYQQYVASFSVPASGNYFMGIKISQDTYWYGMAIDDISLIELPPCTGTPAYAGVANVSPTVICSGPGSADLSVTGTPPVAGLTYQWYEASSASGPFTSISGATTAAYTRSGITATRYFYCSVGCSAGGSAVNTDTVVVEVAPLTPPYIETFESTSAGVNVPCASYTYGWSSGYEWWIYSGAPYSWVPSLDNHTPGGSNWLFAGYGLGTYSGEDEYWFSPGLSLTAAKAYQLTYWYNTDGYTSYDFGARFGTDQSKAAMINVIGTDISDNNTSYKQFSGGFVAGTTGTYYLGIKFKSNDYWYGAAIDDIGLTQLPSCSAKPSAGIAKATPSLVCTMGGSTTLSMVGLSAASDLTYQWQESSDGGVTFSDVSGATTPSFTTDPLFAKMCYRCIVTCPLVGTPNVDTSTIVCVSVGSIIPPYIEDFETATAGTNQPCAGATNWGSYYFNTRTSPLSDYYSTDLDNHTPGGSKWLLGGADLTIGTGMKDYWFTPAIALTMDSTYEFSYWYRTDGYPYGYAPWQFGAYVGTDQADWAMSPLVADKTVTNTTYQQLIARYKAPASGDYYFGIYVSGNYGYGSAIDDINIIQLPACTGAPTVGTITSSPTMLCSAGTADMDMDLGGVSKVTGLTYRWEWTATDPTGGTFTPVGSSTAMDVPGFTTPTLSSTTWFRCIVKCTNTGDSTISSILKLDVGAIVPPYIETFESVTPGNNAPCADATYWGMYGGFYTHGGAYGSWVPSLDNHTPGGSNWLMGGYYISLGGSSDYWFTPGLQLTGGKLYQFSYWYNTDGYVSSSYPFEFGAYIGTAQNAAAMTTAIGPVITPGSPTVYKRYVTKFTPATSGVYYIGIYGKSNYDYGFAIDDIGLQEVPPCSAPVVAGTIIATPDHICSPGNTTSLDLSGSTLATGLTYTWVSAATASGTYSLAGTGTPPFTTPSLSTSTWFKCIVTCAATGKSDTSAAYLVPVGAYDMPYSENFESTAPGDEPLCSDATYWGTNPYDGFRVLTGDPTYSGFSNHTPGGKNYMMAGEYLGYYGYYSPLTDDNYWFTPGLNLLSGYKYELSFYYMGYSSYSQRLGVYYGASQNVSGMTNTLMPFNAISNNTYQLFDTTFAPTVSGVYYIGFRKSASSLGYYSGPGIAFDDINVNYAPCDGMPTAGAVSGTYPSGTGLCKSTFVKLANTGATVAMVPGIKYQWQRKGIGIAPTTWTNITGATDSVIASDTLVGYEYRAVVVCTNTNDSAFTSSFQIPALPAHPPVSIAPSGTISFCLGDTVKLNASNFSSAVYDWMLDSVTVYGWKFNDMGATEPGTYIVKVTSPLSPCPAYSAPVTLVQIDPGYEVVITTPADSMLCSGESVTLTASASKSGLSYQWRKDNIDIPGAIGTSYTITTGGYYRVTATDGISSCAAVSRNVMITVNPNPPAFITPAGGSLTACAEVGVKLNANTGAYSYQWTRSGATIVGWTDSSEVIYNSGTYAVKVRTADGCVSVSSDVTVNILPSPVPVITKTGLTLSTTLTYLSYKWVRIAGSIVTTESLSPTLTLTRKGTYKVIVTDANGCTGESLPIDVMDDGLGLANVIINGSDIKVYPNPTDSKVFIESPVEVKVEVKDVTGKTVYTQMNVTEVDMTKFADGVYLFMISDKSGNQLLKEQRVSKVTNK